MNLEKIKNEKLEKKDNLFSNKEKFQKELEEKEKELENLNKKLSKEEKEIEEKKKTVENNINQKYEINAEINAIDTNFEHYQKREINLQQEIKTTVSELDSTRITKQDIAKTFNEIEQKRNVITKSLEEINKTKQEKNEKIQKYIENINNYETEERIIKAKIFARNRKRKRRLYKKCKKFINRL